MKGSSEIIWELGAALKSKGNLPLSGIGVYGHKNNGLECKFRCISRAGMGEFLGELFNVSLYKTIREVLVDYWVTGQHCNLSVWVEDSNDGTTNIDADVVEAFRNLKWKW